MKYVWKYNPEAVDRPATRMTSGRTSDRTADCGLCRGGVWTALVKGSSIVTLVIGGNCHDFRYMFDKVPNSILENVNGNILALLK